MRIRAFNAPFCARGATLGRVWLARDVPVVCRVAFATRSPQAALVHVLLRRSTYHYYYSCKLVADFNMSITHITSLSQLNGILSKFKDKLSVSLDCTKS